jgi:hypothetical protein
MSWTWKWLDLAIVIAAVAIGFAVFFIPNFMNSDEMKNLVAASNERKAAQAAYKAQQAEIKREQEELGLVYLPPPPQLQDKQKPASKQDK